MMLDDLELELRKLPGVRSTGFEESVDILLVQLHVGPERGDANLAVQATRIAARHSDRPVAVEIVRWRPEPRVAMSGPNGSNGSSADVVATDDPTIDLLDDPVDELTARPRIVPLPGDGDDGGDSADDPTAVSRGESADGRIEGRRARLLAVLAFPDTDELEVHLMVGERRTIGRAPASGGVTAAVEATIEAIRQLGVPIAPRPRWARALDPEESLPADGEPVPMVAVAIEGDESLHFGLACGTSPLDAAARSTLDALNRRLSLFL